MTEPIVSGPAFKRSKAPSVWSSERIYCCETPLLLERARGGKILGIRNSVTGKRVTECPDCLAALNRDRALLRQYPSTPPQAHCTRCAAPCSAADWKAEAGCHNCLCPNPACRRWMPLASERIIAHCVGGCADCHTAAFDAWLTEEQFRG